MNHLSDTQIEQLKLIGAELSEYRQQIKMSLDEVAVKTYIPLRILQAVEQGKSEKLPEAVFVRGFIRRYGDAIGIDGKLISERLVISDQGFEVEATGSLSALPTPKAFANRTGSINVTTKPTYNGRGAAPTPTATGTTTKLKLKGFARPKLEGNTRWLIAGLGGVGAILCGAWVLPMLFPPSAQTQNPTGSVSSASTTQQAVVPVPKKTVDAAVQPPAVAGVKAVVSLTGESWISVTVDGQASYEGVVAKGFTKTWNAKQKIQLSTGNAGVVSVAFNNQKPKVVGQLGEVKEVTISTDGLQL